MSAPVSTNARPEYFRLASYNICNPLEGDEFTDKAQKDLYGTANWGARYVKIVENIRKIDADIIVLFGCTTKTINDLKTDLSDMPGIDTTPPSDKGDHLVILYKNVTCDTQKTLLSSRQTNSPRRWNLSTLFQHGAVVFGFTTGHLCENEGKVRSENLLSSATRRGSFSIVAADFAHERDHEVVKAFTDIGYHSDGNTSPTEPSRNRRVDFIFFRNTFMKLFDPPLAAIPPFVSRKVNVLLPNPDASTHLPAITDFVASNFLIDEFAKRQGQGELQELFEIIKSSNLPSIGEDGMEKLAASLTSLSPSGQQALRDVIALTSTPAPAPTAIVIPQPAIQPPTAIVPPPPVTAPLQPTAPAEPVQTTVPTTPKKWSCLGAILKFFSSVGRWFASWFK